MDRGSAGLKQAGQYRQGPGQAPASHDFRARPPQPSREAHHQQHVAFHIIRDRPQARRVDSIVCGVAPVTTLPGRVIGAKPAAVCRWIFDLLGAGPGDTLDDLFPGSGAVTRAWDAYTGHEPSRPSPTDATAPGQPVAEAS